MEFNEILSRLDFFELVSTKVKLIPNGLNKFKGLSPLTSEKTPSFYVDNQSKTWYCFSSGIGGGVLDYIMQTEGLDRTGAIHFLKDYLNIEDSSNEEKDLNQKIKTLLRLANKYFSSYKTEALNYLISSRGMNEDYARSIIDKYEIGFCPASGSLDHLGTLARDQDAILKSGIFSEKTNFYKYRNRIVMPIRNEYGTIISFTGRDVTGGPVAKYMHGSVSPLFKKSNTAWNLHSIRKMIEEQDKIVVCEGQMDAIAVTEAGIPAVSIMGSKISENQMQQIAKITNNVYMLFDSDRAGEDGLISAFKMISDLDLDSVFYSVVLPSGKDPDEYIKENGVEEFKKIVHDSKPDTSHIIQIFLKRSLSNKNATKSSIIRKILSDLQPYMKKSYTYRALDLMERLSQELGLSRKELQDWASTGAKFGQHEATYKKIEQIQFPAPVYERRIVYSMIKDSNLMFLFKSKNLSIYDFESHLVSRIVDCIQPGFTTNEIFDILKENLEEEEFNLIISFFSQGLPEADFETSLDILQAKVKMKAHKAATNFLGRPITATEREFKRVVGDVVSYEREPF